MNKIQKRTILSIFPAMWLIFYVFSIIKGDIKGESSVLFNLMPFIPAFVLGFLIYLFIEKINFKYRIAVLIGFIALEQGFKLIIKYFIGINTEVELIKNWLYFKPFTNTHGSYINSMLDIKVSFVWINIFKVLLVTLLVLIYRYIIFKEINTRILETGFVFLLAGSVCSLIDTLFWGGSLDYLMLQNMFVTDLKDVYIDIGAGIIIVAALLTDEKNDEDSNIIKDFIRFTFKKY